MICVFNDCPCLLRTAKNTSYVTITPMKRNEDIVLFIMIALMYSTVCMETDIYVPAFPDMKLFFFTTAESIQKTLSFNFFGLCLGSLIFGPLSDSYGRKIALLLGLILFAIFSWACLLTTKFDLFLLCRFFQGLGAASPMVITFAMMLEKYEPKKFAQICGGLNLFITGMMAAAPILGSFLNIYFGWQSTFLLIAVAATLSLIGSCYLVPETLTSANRITFSFPRIIMNYGIVLTNFSYMAAALVCYLMFSGLVVFTANLSLIFIDYMGIAKSSYGFYQAAAPAAFALFSFLSIWIIGRYGIEKTKRAGLGSICIGISLLVITALFQPSPSLICIAMVVFTIGVALAAPIYGMESANVFPEMRGIATGMSNALRYVITAGTVAFASCVFNGIITPVVITIAIATVIIIILAGLLAIKNIGEYHASSIISDDNTTLTGSVD